jgi:Domain of unknown function (DUF5666)
MDTDALPTDRMTTLPTPSRSSRWRWSTTRNAALCGGALLGVLAFGGGAGASTTHTGQSTGKPPSGTGTNTGKPPSSHGPRTNGKGMQPTAGGKITALSGDEITIATRNSTTETVTYSDSTTFRTMSGTTTAASLKVGEFIMVRGTKASNGDVTATTIMVSTGPPGNHNGKPGQGGPPKGGRGPAA